MCVCLTWVLVCAGVRADNLPRFREHVITQSLTLGYQLVAVDCVVDDFTGDGRPDILCVGASTGNVKLYENLGR